MALTDKTIKNAKPSTRRMRLFDERALYLEVSPAGGKWWRLRIDTRAKRSVCREASIRTLDSRSPRAPGTPPANCWRMVLTPRQDKRP